VIKWFAKLFGEGIQIPLFLAYDPVTKLPSVTLLFFYISYVISTLITTTSSVFLLMKGEYLSATWMPTLSVLLGFVCYRLRSLDKIRIDLDDRAIELDDDTKGS
jgi:hypothetical protein